ncbi:MAG TPA: hemolysin family protein [Spirochaetota bacterium]|nr:hemolysin family protein [Spirochaetota bacterium]
MDNEQGDDKKRRGFLKRIARRLKRGGVSGGGDHVPGGHFNMEDLRGLEPARLEMIRGVVNLGRRIVREIMIPRVDIVSVADDTSLKELAKTICEAGHSRVPVYRDSIDTIVGVLHVKDLLRFLADRPRKFNLKKLAKKPYFVPETMPLDELLREFKKRRLHMAVAVDEYGGLGGIVTLEDILEEIVGEISDEFDGDELPEFRRTGRNSYEADSRMSLADFCDELDVDLPCDEFDTLGGYVLDLFGKIPAKDETVRSGNLAFRIKDVEGTRINRIAVTVSRGGSAGD